jgi:hypothetical protein
MDDVVGRWHRAIDEHLAALGWLVPSPAHQHALHRIVLVPAFHPASCLVLQEQPDGAELYLGAAQQSPGARPGRLWETLVTIDAPTFQPLATQLRNLAPRALAADDLRGRDGLVARCDSFTPAGLRTTWMVNPAATSPDQARLLRSALELARSHLDIREARDYAEQLLRRLAQ